MPHMIRIFAISILCLINVSALAQPAPKALDECENAKSTGDHLSCANKMIEESQLHLNTVFEKVLAAQKTDYHESLRTSQKDWLVYRNQQCKWETTQSENESLKRIHELTCLARITNTRTANLSSFITQNDVQDSASETPFPTWINALSEDNADIFWQLDDRLRADLDCDGIEENALLGLKLDEKAQITRFLGLTKNPRSGRPTTHLVALSSTTIDGKNECTELPTLEMVESANAQNTELAEKQETQDAPKDLKQEDCRAVLKINYQGCAPSYVTWTEENPQKISMGKPQTIENN